jgi:hypothetical protein
MPSTDLIPVSDVQTLAVSVARSRLFPAFDTAEKALVLMMLAQAEGCHPIQAVQRYDLIAGKPAKKTDAMLADFQQRGGTVKWLELSSTAVEAEFSAKGLGTPVRVRWDMKRAETAGLGGKDMWKKFPQNMLRARVVSEGIRLADPGVVAGLYTPEEVADFDSRPAASIVPPSAQPDQPEIVEAEVVASDDPKVKAAKVRTLVLAIKAAGVAEADRKSWMSDRLGKPVESSKDLTIAELENLTESAEKQREEAANANSP